MPPDTSTPDNPSLLDRLARTPALSGGATLWLTGEEHLRVSSFGSLASVELAIRYRLLSPENRLRAGGERHVPNSDRTIARTFHALAEGWLSGVEVFASSGSPKRGQVYVIIELTRGLGSQATPLQVLWHGYVTDTIPRGWPASASEDSTAGAGVLRVITGTNPAAGVEFSETVPTNARWRLQALLVTLTASAAAANRFPILILDDGASPFFASDPPAVQTANQVFNYTAGNATQRLAAIALNAMWSLPSECWLPAGARFRSSTSNLQAGDDWSSPVYLVEEYLED